MKKEYDIHDIIKTHPYILGPEFAELSIKHERIYEDRSRADFVFSDKNISVVVEVKIGDLDIQTIKQAIHYLDEEKKKYPQKKILGLLIADNMGDNYLLKKIEHSGHQFEIKLLNKDIPVDVKLCDKCRKINDLYVTICRYCNSKKFITDPFLFNRVNKMIRKYPISGHTKIPFRKRNDRRKYK